MKTQLLVDGKEIPLSEFPAKILSGMVIGSVAQLRGIHEEWKKIEIKVSK